MTGLSVTVTGAVELLEAAKAEDTVSDGAHNVDGLSLTLGLAEDPVGKSGEGGWLLGLSITLFVKREGGRSLGMRWLLL